MAKRKREIDDYNNMQPSSSKDFEFKNTKHSLDSDEEDEEAKNSNLNKYDPSKLEGQEPSSVEYDGNIKITPFNMKDEMDDGYIDKDQNFVFQKEKLIQDSWLDNIENVKITSTQNISTSYLFKEDSEFRSKLDVISHYKSILPLLKPGESISKALQRYGKSQNIPASLRWKMKREGQSIETNAEDKEHLNQLTSLANDIINSGNMDIYQYTYEKIKFLISENDKLANLPSSSTDEAFDMFGENYDAQSTASNDSKRIKLSKEAKEITDDNETMWLYKMENTEESEVIGPHPTSKMIEWLNDGRFQDGVWVRREDQTDSPFYNSKRIDFDLYT